MKVKLLRRLGQNKAGAVVEYTDGEAEWLIDRELAEEAKGSAKSSEEPKTPESDPDKEPTLAELKEQAEKLGLATYGSKAQIQERIAAHEESGNE